MPAKRFERELVKGWLHEPETKSTDGIAITHGAGGDCESPLLKTAADAFSSAGLWVLRFDLPYRQQRPRGSPYPAQAARDREGIARAIEELRAITAGRIYLAGHSYGGRQATMLAAEKPAIADALLLLSYPLHPPGKPENLRVTHFPKLQTPALFVHGTRDAFGSIEEMQVALRAIPARTELITVQGAPHGIPPAAAPDLPAQLLRFVTR